MNGFDFYPHGVGQFRVLMTVNGRVGPTAPLVVHPQLPRRPEGRLLQVKHNNLPRLPPPFFSSCCLFLFCVGVLCSFLSLPPSLHPSFLDCLR